MSGKSFDAFVQSVHQRLINVAHQRKEDPNLIFIRYGMERLLYRLSCSAHCDRFILKGAMLFALWTDQIRRPTRDLDFLGMGDASDEGLLQAFCDVLLTEVEPDGLVFMHEDLSISDIREGREYSGKRMKIPAKLGGTVLKLQIDIGFGDAITPKAWKVDYPTLLDLPTPKIRVYPHETVIAEKLEAMVSLGRATSRMKDYYDLWTMSQKMTFAGSTLVQAITATFTRRRTSIPDSIPFALTQGFAQNTTKQAQWKGFLRRNGFHEINLSQVVEDLGTFLAEPIQSAANQTVLSKSWSPNGPWT